MARTVIKPVFVTPRARKPNAVQRLQLRNKPLHMRRPARPANDVGGQPDDNLAAACRPAIVIVVIMRAMISLAAFAAIFAATGGGPGTASEILNLYAFKTSFVELNFGYGSALAVSLLVITMAVSAVLFYLRTARKARTVV